MVSVKGRVSKCVFPSPCPAISSPQDYTLAWPQLLFLLQVKIRSASKIHWENISDIYLSASRSLAHHTSLIAKGEEERTVLTPSEKLYDARGHIILLDKNTVFRCWWRRETWLHGNPILWGLSYFAFWNLGSGQEGRDMGSLEQFQLASRDLINI